jgi:ribonuclease P protein component
VTRVHQTDFPAEQPEAQAAPRVPRAHGDQERPEDPGLASRQGPQAAERVTVGDSRTTTHNTPPLEVLRLKVRREFLFVAEGYAERRRLIVVQARRRNTPRPEAGAGFTTTKKIGNAVIRNRARRRLREAARSLLPGLGVGGADYVFVARQETAAAPWPRLLDDMEKALISLRQRLLPPASAPSANASAPSSRT